VHNALLEERLTRGKGWVEFPFCRSSALSLIAEGSSNYGIDLASPGGKAAYEARVLAPLAGLNSAEVGRYDQLLDAIQELSTARNSIAQMFLDGQIDEARRVRLTQRYQLVSEARARQSVAFTRQYRSYVITIISGARWWLGTWSASPARPSVGGGWSSC
jgi:predicted aminopeptidase